jgi:hypothetical protein
VLWAELGLGLEWELELGWGLRTSDGAPKCLSLIFGDAAAAAAAASTALHAESSPPTDAISRANVNSLPL